MTTVARRCRIRGIMGVGIEKLKINHGVRNQETNLQAWRKNPGPQMIIGNPDREMT